MFYVLEYNPEVATRILPLHHHSDCLRPCEVKKMACKADDIVITIDEKQPLITKPDCVITIDVSDRIE